MALAGSDLLTSQGNQLAKRLRVERIHLQGLELGHSTIWGRDLVRLLGEREVIAGVC